MPVFCRGSHSAHGTRDKPGSVNVPISCGGVVVYPGDLMVGTLDGLLVVRREDASLVVEACETKTARLAANGKAMTAQGRTFFDLIGGKETIRRAGVQWND